MRLGTGFTATRLDPGRDYRIVLPDQKKIGGTVLEGGRNIVIVGGQVSADPSTTSDFERRGIYIKNAVGTVHIEGVEIDGAGLPFDGIAINAPEATVQIQNVRVTNLNGSYDGFHADVIQPWGGVRDLRVDRVTGSSNYQGLFLQPDLGPIGSATIQNVDLTHTGDETSRGAYMMWVANGCTSYPMSLSNVYVRAHVTVDLNRMVYPSATTGPALCAAEVSGGSASWPKLPVTGTVAHGSPAGGSFVPAGVAGTGYVSPGYGTTTEAPTVDEPTVDSAPPTTSITCNGAMCSSPWFNAGVSVALAASDADGSGVAVTCYTTDGSDPVASAGACTNGASYAAPFTVSTTSTVRFRSYDHAGNAEGVSSQLVQVDGQPPTDVAITSPANGATLIRGNNLLTATASDASSGVASVRFYVDGRLIATDSSAPYSTIWSTRKKDRGLHTLYVEATDAAGNVTRSPAITVRVT